MMRHNEAFLVRFWSEPGIDDAGRPDIWRGSVLRLDTQERRYFSNVLELITFLTTYAGRPTLVRGDRDA
jgi:hypothetical protein